MPKINNIFVSYSETDEQPLPRMKGEVSTFLDKLDNLLEKEGHKNALERSRHDLGSVPVTSQDNQMLKNSAILLLFLSPGYLNSKWCCSVFETFVDNVKNLGRVFVVEIDDIKDDDIKDEESSERMSYLKHTNKHKFYEKDGSGIVSSLETETYKPSTEYEHKLNCLAIELAYELKKLNALKLEELNYLNEQGSSVSAL